MKKSLYKKILPPLEALMVILIMSSSITFILTYINMGFTDQFASQWLKGFTFAFFLIVPIAFSATFIFGLIIENLFGKKLSNTAKKVTQAICVGFSVELFMSFITVFNNIGLVDGFFISWMSLYVKSLPLGIIIGLIMSFIVKPWLSRHKI